ncbi:trichothecene 3-O-acetyltransferase [Aspergillus affinis]|uniref:trichothecene 3-O-acetyltransferase n=1 Tax=Aspergillus affinis TaxID=1070780 RepID=UPI0022FDE419|nr:trichothecene 3-O-acetyltransferase [Aspergillus affinis]KAI9037541.1 trichothecene 3-O-acetyltransferase [Aspergillus affinis]
MDECLDIFGQQTFTINIQSCFCFSLPDASAPAQSVVINTLARGLERLHASFPWLSGQVVNEGSGDGDTGRFLIRPLENVPKLVVKNLQPDSLVATMEVLRRANFPMSMLDQDILAPRKIFPEDNSESAPVFLVQANFNAGGLLLTFVAQHNAMDAIGLGHIIHLFSKACRNESFNDQELRCTNLPRRNIVPLLEHSDMMGAELDRYIVKTAPYSNPSGVRGSLLPNCTWTSFKFSHCSLIRLKLVAMGSLTSPSFVSTDDALTAFIWQSVARVRLLRLDPSIRSTLMRAVDVRGLLGISPFYPGPIQSNVYTGFTLQELTEESLGGVALRLRSALNDKSRLANHTRAVATFLSCTSDKSIFSFGAKLDTTTDLILSSWAKVESYRFDFNLGLGLPEAVRKPRCNEVEGLTFVLPKTLEGEIVVALCLRLEDIERLRCDADFIKYAEYIG